ncbi:MAG: VOC family protein [Alphaproteobacteria bacterium]|nr:VOC family protein [Alphaproteobacteria bacterium]
MPPSTPVCNFDHCILAVRDLATASATFRALGFTLSPPGRHPARGTANACIMFANGYIELLALDTPDSRESFLREFLDAGEGISAIALAPDDTDRCHGVLARWDAADGAPVTGSRAMETPSGVREVRFRVCRVKGQPILPGRVFFCEHLDREHVYAAPLLRHANGARRLAGLTVIGDTAAVIDAERAVALGLVRRDEGNAARLDAGGVVIEIVPALAHRSRLRPPGQMVAPRLAIAGADIAAVAAAARGLGIAVTEPAPRSISLAVHGVDIALTGGDA